jgi:hypothetical protein
VNDNQQPSNVSRLKALLKEAGLKSIRLDATRRVVTFTGRTRDWTFIANIYNGWLHVYTYVCEVPDASGLRNDLLDAAMAANQTMSLTKFSKNSGLVLELEYRDEHIDGEIVKNLFSLILANAEEYYPRMFRVVSGDAALGLLEESAITSIT